MSLSSPRALLGVAAFAVALAAADTYVVVLALPDMMASVGVGFLELQKATPIISGFLLGYVAVLPLIGRLADLVDRRRILVACLVVFVVGSMVTALASELPVMVGGRVLQGLGGGGLVPATLALVADLWPRGRRGTALGVVGGVQELGSVLGPVLGVAVLAVAGWREIFWLNAVLGVLLGMGVWWLGRHAPATVAPVRGTGARRAWSRTRAGTVSALLGLAILMLTLWGPSQLVNDVELGTPFVPFSRGGPLLASPMGLVAGVLFLVALMLVLPAWVPLLRSADWVGAVLVAVALGALVLTFSSADPEREVLGPWGLWLVPIGVVALAAYVVRHRRVAHPLIGRGVLAGRVWPSLVVSALVGTALVAIVVTVPILARVTWTQEQSQAALLLVRFLVLVPVGAVAGGWLLRRTGPGVVAAPGLALAAGALAMMSRWGEGSLTQTVPVTFVLAAAGLGIGLAIAPVNDAALADAPDDAHGMASALVVVARMVGMVLGLAVLMALGLRRYYTTVQAMSDRSDIDAILHAGIVQCQTIFLGAAIAAAAAAVVALALGRRQTEHDPEVPVL